MIKRLFLFVLVCVMHTAMYAQTDTQSKAQMVFSNDFHDASGQLGNLTAHFITEKTWTDMNGEIGAIVRIKVTGMSVSEMSKLKVIGSANASVHDTQFLENEQEYSSFVAKAERERHVRRDTREQPHYYNCCTLVARRCRRVS